MESDLAGAAEGAADRFVPDRDRGRLIEVEHLARYHWAAQAAENRTVLDAGCGTGYGSRILAAAGAREVVGIDIAADVLAAATTDLPDAVSLQSGDLGSLEFESERFELVVCFETVEHVDDPMAALDELSRVLTADGILLISSPSRLAYPSGSPGHRRQLAPAELEVALGDRFPHVRILRQSAYLSSAVLSGDTVALGHGAEMPGVNLRKLQAGTAAEETYTIAVAGRKALPELSELAMLTGTFELSEWLAASETQAETIAAREAQIAELQQRLSERDHIADLLTEAELALAEVPELRGQIATLEQDLQAARSAAAVARREAAELDRALLYGRRLLRHARPLVQLLRLARRRLRGV